MVEIIQRSSTYKKDTELFSLRTGVNPVISDARERLQRVPNAFDLLLSLLSYSPINRPSSLYSVLLGGAFRKFRKSPDSSGDSQIVIDIPSYSTKSF
jgi:hypothetical protein